MLMEVKRNLRLILNYFCFNLAAALEYRVSFFWQVWGMFLNNAAFLLFWVMVYAKVSRIGEFGLREVMFLWALSSSAYGFLHLIFGNIGEVGQIILKGELDPYLLQPKDVCLNLLCSRMVVSAWGDFFYGLIIYLIFYGFDLGKLLLFILFTLMSGLLMGSVILIAQSLTFFFGNVGALSRLIFGFLLNFSLYPESIFRKWLHLLIYSIIPAGFIVFMPLKLINFFSWSSLGWLLLIDLFYLFLAYGFFNLGLRRYESGNLIGVKL